MGQLGNFGALLAFLVLAQSSLSSAHREHKVHNIVLYPDKESWCKTTPIKQVVTWPSCAPQELDNNVCVGACFSYMVPHSEPSAPGDLIRPYCDSCQPLDSVWHTVTLDCKDKDDQPTTMQKKVQIITNCSCSSCTESSRIKPDFDSLLQSLELAHAALQFRGAAAAAARRQQHKQEQQQQQPQETPTDQPPMYQPAQAEPPQTQEQLQREEQQQQQHHEHHETVQSSTEAEQQQQQQQQQQQSTQAPSVISAPEVVAASESVPREPAPVVVDPAKQQQQQQSSDEAPAAGLQGATHGTGSNNETPDLLLNPNLNGSSSYTAAARHGGLLANERFVKLFKQLKDSYQPKDKLEKLEKLEGIDKLEKLEKIELLSQLTELLHKYSAQEEPNESREGSSDDDEGAEPKSSMMLDQLLQLVPRASSSLPPPPPPADPKDDEDDEEVPSLSDQQLRVAEALQHRGHSLLLDSDVKEKIDVASDYLHPALEGQEISYHDNHVDKTKKKSEDEFAVE
ncbi:hypothetical protein TKK_0019378 [Trichogramma kaykai]